MEKMEPEQRVRTEFNFKSTIVCWHYLTSLVPRINAGGLFLTRNSQRALFVQHADPPVFAH